jgi:hypothetical protein
LGCGNRLRPSRDGNMGTHHGRREQHCHSLSLTAHVALQAAGNGI